MLGSHTHSLDQCRALSEHSLCDSVARATRTCSHSYYLAVVFFVVVFFFLSALLDTHTSGHRGQTPLMNSKEPWEEAKVQQQTAAAAAHTRFQSIDSAACCCEYNQTMDRREGWPMGEQCMVSSAVADRLSVMSAQSLRYLLGGSNSQAHSGTTGSKAQNRCPEFIDRIFVESSFPDGEFALG